MCRNPINFLYNPGHVTLWYVKVGLVANAREGSTQEHDWSRVGWVMRLGDEAHETLIKTCFTDGFKYVNHIDDSAKL